MGSALEEQDVTTSTVKLYFVYFPKNQDTADLRAEIEKWVGANVAAAVDEAYAAFISMAEKRNMKILPVKAEGNSSVFVYYLGQLATTTN